MLRKDKIMDVEAQELAEKVASESAKLYAKQERGKDKPFSIEYVTMVVASDIGDAFFESGRSSEDIPVLERRLMALWHLKCVGYPGAQKKFDEVAPKK